MDSSEPKSKSKHKHEEKLTFRSKDVWKAVGGIGGIAGGIALIVCGPEALKLRLEHNKLLEHLEEIREADKKAAHESALPIREQRNDAIMDVAYSACAKGVPKPTKMEIITENNPRFEYLFKPGTKFEVRIAKDKPDLYQVKTFEPEIKPFTRHFMRRAENWQDQCRLDWAPGTGSHFK